MAIIKQYPAELTAKDKYDLIRSPEIQKLSDVKGQTLDVTAYILREDTDSQGEIIRILSIKTADGDMFATNSPVCIREFEAILECTDAPFALKILDGVSRAGRHFVTCAWAG